MSVPFLGDYDTTEKVWIPFNTFDSNDPAASVTVTTLLNTDCHVHKDGAVAQRTSSAGEVLSLNFDGITGNHLLELDLSDNTDAGFYADGSIYQVRIEGATVSGGNINAWIGQFSIGRTLRPTTAGRTLDVSAGGEAGLDWANVGSQTTSVTLSGTTVGTTTTNTDMLQASAIVSGGAITTSGGEVATVTTAKTVTTNTDTAATLGSPAGASIAADIAAVKTDTTQIAIDTSAISGLATPTDIVSGGAITTSGGAVATVTSTGTVTGNVNGSVASVTGAVGSVTGNVGGSVASVTGAVGSVTGAVGSVTGNVGGNVAGSVDSVTNQVSADVTAISGDATAANNLEESATAIVVSAVNDPGAAATAEVFITDLTQDTNDHYNGRIVIFTTGALTGQASDILDYNGTTKEITVTAMTDIPADNDEFVIV